MYFCQRHTTSECCLVVLFQRLFRKICLRRCQLLLWVFIFFLYFWFSFNLRSESLNVQSFGDLVLYKAQKIPQALIISSRFSYWEEGGMAHYVSLLFAKNQDCIWK